MLHFGSLIASKGKLAGIDDESKKKYVRNILKDPAISVNHYVFPTDYQIQILKKFAMTEQDEMFKLRGELFRYYEEKEFACGIREALTRLKRYENPIKYTEFAIKGFAYRTIVEDLKNTSKILRNPNYENYLVISYVDGGFPFVFWWDSFLNNPPSYRFSTTRTPIYGITQGDEYYPVVSLAGNIASIMNSIKGMIYPQAVKDISEISNNMGSRLENLFVEYHADCAKPRFHNRVLFIGGIDEDLQYTIPYIMHRKSMENHDSTVFEALRIRSPFETFIKEFGAKPSDIIVLGTVGNLNKEEEQSLIKAAENFGASNGIRIMKCEEFIDGFEELAKSIIDYAGGSNLTTDQMNRIETKINDSIQRIKCK